ncbi:hypothetical protein GCM10009793_15710 [Brachybacterium phenoliresistens]
MSHTNAALTPRHRLIVARLVVDDDWPISEVAARFQVSRPTVKRWGDRYQAGESMQDRSSRPKASPGAAAGDLIRRFGIRASWSALMLALAASTVVLAVLPGVLAVAPLASAVFGASYIALSGLLLIWGTEVYPQAPAAGVGLAFLLIAVGQAVGAPVVGAVSDGRSPAIAFAAAAVLAVLGAGIRPR